MLSSEAKNRSSWHEVPASPEEDVGKSDPNLLHLTPAASRPSAVPACRGTALKQSCLNRWFMILAAVKHVALFFFPFIHKSFLANSGLPAQVCVWQGSEPINEEILPVPELAVQLLGERGDRLVGRACSGKLESHFFAVPCSTSLQTLP